MSFPTCDECVQERKKDKKKKGADAAAADTPDIERFDDEAVAAAALLLEEEVLALKEVGAAPASALQTAQLHVPNHVHPAAARRGRRLSSSSIDLM